MRALPRGSPKRKPACSLAGPAGFLRVVQQRERAPPVIGDRGVSSLRFVFSLRGKSHFYNQP